MVDQLKKLDASLDMNIDPTLDMQLNDYYNDVIMRYSPPPSNITNKVIANMVMPEELDPDVHLTQQQQQYVQEPSDLSKLKQAYENQIQQQMNLAVSEVYVNNTVKLALEKQKAEHIKLEEQEQEELIKEKQEKQKLVTQLKEEEEREKKLQDELLKSKQVLEAQNLQKIDDEDKKKKKKHHHHHNENENSNITAQASPLQEDDQSLFSAIKQPDSENSLFQSIKKTDIKNEPENSLFSQIKKTENKQISLFSSIKNPTAIPSEESLFAKIKTKPSSPQELAELFKKQQIENVKSPEEVEKNQGINQQQSLFDKIKSNEPIDFKDVSVQPIIQEQSLFEKIKEPKKKNDNFQNMKFTEKEEIISQNSTTQLPPNINVILSDQEKQMKAYEDEQNEILREQEQQAKDLAKFAEQKNKTKNIEEMRLKQTNSTLLNESDLPKFTQVNKNMYDEIDKHIADQKDQDISEDSFLTKKDNNQASQGDMNFKQQNNLQINEKEINQKFIEDQKKVQFARQQEKSKFSEKQLNELESKLLQEPEKQIAIEKPKHNSLFGKLKEIKPQQEQQQKSSVVSDQTSDNQILNKKLDQVIDMFQQFMAMQMKQQMGQNYSQDASKQPQALLQQSQQIEQPKFNQIDLKNNLENKLLSKDSDFDQRLNQLKESIEGNQSTYETLTENIEESEPRFIESKINVTKESRFKDFQEKQDDWSDEAALIPNFYVFGAQ